MPARRLVLALVIALLGGALGVAATGIGERAQPERGLPIPDAWPGDAAIYTSGEEELHVLFTQAEWRDAEGRSGPRLVIHHEVSQTGWSTWYKAWLDGTTVLASQVFLEGGGGTGTLRGPVEAVHSGQYMTYESVYDAARSPLCGLVHGLQGSVASSASILTSPGCAGDLGLTARRGGAMTFDDGAGTRLEIDAALPVPRSITLPERTWTLTGFARGSAPLGTGPWSDGGLVPIVPGGIPDTTGVVQSFPLAEALAAALDGPAPNALRTFMESRPRAYLAAANTTTVEDGGQYRHVWTLTASDGVAAAAVRVSREAALARVPGTGIAQSTPWLPVPRVDDAAPAEGPFPAGAPTHAIHLASLAARWQEARHDDTPHPTAWGFTVRCGATCDEAASTTWFGVDLHRTVVTCGEPGDEYPIVYACGMLQPLWLRDQLHVDDDGRAVRALRTDWAFYGAVSAAEQPVVVGDAATPEGPPPQATQPAAVTWTPPPAPVTVAVAAISILLGLLYALWPNMKLLALGLVKNAREPNNPVRAAIVAAVRARPGIHFQQLRRVVARPAGTLRHHLRLLEHDGVITSHLQGGYRCHFPAEGGPRTAGAGALKAAAARQMLQGVLETGRLTMAAAAARAGISPSAATHHAVRLEQAGLLSRVRRGRATELHPSLHAQAALEASLSILD